MADRRVAHTKQKEADQALERHKRAAKALNLQSQRQEHELEKLQDELTSKTPQTGVVDSYNRQLEEARESVERDENAYSDSVVEKDRLNLVARELKDQLNKANDAIRELEAQVRKAEKQAQKAETARQNATFVKNEAYGRISDAQIQEQRLQQEREEQMEQVEYFQDQASNVSARVAVDPTETVKTLEEKLKRFKQIIDANNEE
jgi:chromosome segregation ATPase